MGKFEVICAALTLIGGVSGFLYILDRRKVHNAQEGGDPTVCPVCGGDVPADGGVCSVCGQPVSGHAHVHEPEPGPSVLEKDSTTTDRSDDFAKRLDRMAGKHR